MRNGPYVLVIAPADFPGKRYRDRYCYEHHLVFWQWTGELVPDGQQLHHKNEDKHDNRPENLELVDTLEHGRRHQAKPNAVCHACGRPFHVPPWKLRRSPVRFCSRRCYQLAPRQPAARGLG